MQPAYPLLSALVLAAAGCLAHAPAPSQLTQDHEVASLQEAGRWANPDNAVILSLATQYFASRRDQDAYAYFSERAQAVPTRALFLALSGLFQARMAGQIPLLKRIAWAKDALHKLDQAVALD